MNRTIERKVRERARRRCEYCRIPECVAPFVTFHIDHIRAQKHGGSDDPDNLAWSCHHCNLHKGTNLSGIDPLTEKMHPLFNPRKQSWKRHFEWLGSSLLGRTPTGRATIAVLNMNDPQRVELRQLFMDAGEWPDE